MSDETPTLEVVVDRLDQLTDLFRRRLQDDRTKARALEELSARLAEAQSGPFRQYLHPVVRGLALILDRLDRYQGPDPEFAGSVRDELLEVLRTSGVETVSSAAVFDPAQHEVVAVEPDVARGAVVTVERRGLRHGDWVFRPAQVVVGTGNGTGDGTGTG